jgi:HPt (histidine-containing phosphotransfer) domain-containing protein
MMDVELAATGENWRGQVNELQALLDELRPRLIEAETQLAERLAAISAFEYQVRARLEGLTRRLDDLQDEIDELRRLLRRYQNDVFGEEDEALSSTSQKEQWRFDDRSGAAASGSFRYRPNMDTFAPKPLASDEAAALKNLYRQLARRFHPDLALDDADRAHRTGLMMAINDAYTAGDLEKLQRLALEPSPDAGALKTDEQLAEALQREVERCRQRLQEIEQELAQLERHQSARLMKRAERAAAIGRDLLQEIAVDLRRRIAEKLVERDILEEQLDEVEREGLEMSAEDLADIVYNLGLEQAGEDSLFTSFGEWQPKNRNRWDQKGLEDEENTLDELD